MNKSLSIFSGDIASTISSALRSSVAKNAISLYLIQLANYVLPLITVPYLVRVLGPPGYGMVSFGQSLVAYFAIFVDYGFTLSATRRISIERDNLLAVSHTVFNVWAAKTFLCLVSFTFLLLLINVVPKLHEVSTLLLILYCTVIGNVLFPVWLFQGMERMASLCLINLIMRLFVVVGIFTLVRHQEDYLLYAGLMSLGSIGAGLAGAGVALSKFKLHFVMPSLRGIWESLVEGWLLFLSMASVSLYTAGNAFILGILANHTVVGYYSAAEKIVKAIIGLIGPISQAAYPRFSKMASDAKDLALNWGRRMIFVMGGTGIILSILLLILSPIIVNIVLGTEFERSIKVMQILSLTCFVIAISNVLGIQIMIPFEKEKAFTLILFSAGIFNILLAILFTSIWQEIGMALVVLLTEIFVTGSMFIYLSFWQLNPLFTFKKDMR